MACVIIEMPKATEGAPLVALLSFVELIASGERLSVFSGNLRPE